MRVNPPLKILLPNLAHANDFALNPQPSAYFGLVPRRLTAKDEYAKRRTGSIGLIQIGHMVYSHKVM